MARPENEQRTGSTARDDSLDRGLAEAFGPDSHRSVFDSLTASIGALPRVVLRDTLEPDAPPARLNSAELPAEGSVRYQLFGVIARGGMGAVIRGRDADLGRELAVKVLLDRHRNQPEMVKRFVEEAQIGGQLQHPGIVPVYELGTFADRRPFFAMKLVKGKTLSHLLKARSSPEADLPRFLGIFEQVAQTVAYVHARGVIHRDLKPSNVMVGSFGEVQVMDWGLAKVLSRGGVADDETAGRLPPEETVIATARSVGADVDLSQPGSVLGTPSYMAPEQARGEVKAIDERADVFALGSILCEILTGQPAFMGRSTAEIQRQAARADLAGALARLTASKSDAELIGLASDCLAVEPDDRPRDASVVAARTTAYLAGVQEKLQRAELEKIEERARRRITTVVATGMLALVVFGSAGWYWVEHGRQARRSAAVAAIAEARLLAEQALHGPLDRTERWAEAIAAVKQADGLLAGAAAPALEGELVALRAQVETGRRDAEAELKLLAEMHEIAGDYYDHRDELQTDRACILAFQAFRLDLERTEPKIAAARLAGRRSTVEIAAGLDMWCRLRRHAKNLPNRLALADVARAADPDPWRNALRDQYDRPLHEALPILQAKAADLEALEKQPAASLLLLSMTLGDAGEFERAQAVLRVAGRRFPGEFWVRFEQGYVSRNRKLPVDAVRYFEAAAALRPESSSAHRYLGVALAEMHQWDEAVAELREAIRLRPGYAWSYHELGLALRGLKQIDKAVTEFREAIRILPGHPVPHHFLGMCLREQGETDEAITEFREAMKLDGNRVGAAPFALGELLLAKGRRAEAIDVWRRVLELDCNSVPAYNNLRIATLTANPPRFEQLRAEWEKRLDRNPSEHGAWFGYTELCAFLRNEAAYERARHALLARFGKTTDLIVAERTSRACLLSPLAGDDLERASALADHALAASPAKESRGWFHFATGLAEYRRNHLQQATRLLRLSADAGVRVESLLLLAMIQHRAGQTQEARETLIAALRSYDWSELRATDHQAWIAHVLRREAQGLIVPNVPAFLRLKQEPVDNVERLSFITACHTDGLYAEAAELARAAFAADPKLADAPGSFRRYNAACAAALAGCGKGKDDPLPDRATRTMLRTQALAWLNADLGTWFKRVADDSKAAPNVQRVIEHWRSDPDLAGVREATALDALPEAERRDWQALWTEVDRLRAKSTQTP
jgi:eukaryotic-like serine/threonine-protein kinase